MSGEEPIGSKNGILVTRVTLESTTSTVRMAKFTKTVVSYTSTSTMMFVLQRNPTNKKYNHKPPMQNQRNATLCYLSQTLFSKTTTCTHTMISLVRPDLCSIKALIEAQQTCLRRHFLPNRARNMPQYLRTLVCLLLNTHSTSPPLTQPFTLQFFPFLQCLKVRRCD